MLYNGNSYGKDGFGLAIGHEKKIKRLLIIPAKSNSSRIKNKNFKKFLGKPIIKYSYQVAKKSKIFDKIHISTESNKVKNFLKKNNIRIDFLKKKSSSL